MSTPSYNFLINLLRPLYFLLSDGGNISIDGATFVDIYDKYLTIHTAGPYWPIQAKEKQALHYVH